MYKLAIFAVTVVAAVVTLATGSNSNLEYVKERASPRWEEVGFKVVGYQGHQWGRLGFGTPYGGAKVWYELRAVPDNGITYSGYIVRWGNDLEVYGPTPRESLIARSRK